MTGKKHCYHLTPDVDPVCSAWFIGEPETLNAECCISNLPLKEGIGLQCS